MRIILFCLWLDQQYFAFLVSVCLSKGIPYRERAPSWSERELWEEAFVTSKSSHINYDFRNQFSFFSLILFRQTLSYVVYFNISRTLWMQVV